ncbi:MAG: hypothetical protein WCT27_04240 [Patescibacteria group bacterium]|jgi:hypothetical protein
MAIRHGQPLIEHDQVILASAATYEKFRSKGFLVSVNLTGKPVHNIGGSNFPDVIVWRTGGDFGKTEIIEEIETSETVTDQEAKEWDKYSRFGATFYLIVPKDSMDRAEEIVKRLGIKVDAIEGYYFDYHSQVKFITRQPHKHGERE